MKNNPSQEYIKQICDLYGDVYDDREEDSAPGGLDWQPGVKASHLSLSAFQHTLEQEYNIKLSTSKIRKILISGGCWTTERSREVQELYEKYGNIREVAETLEVSDALVTMYLPYEKTVYDLEDKSGNAKRIDRWREKKRKRGNEGVIFSVIGTSSRETINPLRYIQTYTEIEIGGSIVAEMVALGKHVIIRVQYFQGKAGYWT